MTTLGPKATWGTLHNQVRYFVSDAPGVSDTWDDTQVVDAINFAINELCKLTRYTYTEKTKTIPATGLVSLGLPGDPTAVNYITLVRVAYLGVDLLKTTTESEAARSATWRTDTAASGEPTRRWLLYDGDTVRLIKLQTAWNGTQSCTIGYIERPTPLAADADVVDPRIPEHLHRHLKYAAAAFLYQIDGAEQDVPKSQKLMEEFAYLVKGVRPGGA